MQFVNILAAVARMYCGEGVSFTPDRVRAVARIVESEPHAAEIDEWLGTLTEDQISILVGGTTDPDEMRAIEALSPHPAATSALLESIFNA